MHGEHDPHPIQTAALGSGKPAKKPASTITGLVDDDQLHALGRGQLLPALQAVPGSTIPTVPAEVEVMITAARQRDAQILADPRYANAPAATATLALQHWRGRKQEDLVEVDQVAIVLPTTWPARKDRNRLESTADEYVDRDWIVHDLGADGDHHGPFELELNGVLAAGGQSAGAVAGTHEGPIRSATRLRSRGASAAAEQGLGSSRYVGHGSVQTPSPHPPAAVATAWQTSGHPKSPGAAPTEVGTI